MVGRTISHYRIVSQLGAGGMGVVYGAEDVRLGRLVALKFVPEELARDQRAVDRFRVEARAASGLNHANICTIYDIGEDEGRPYIVMEAMKGQTLRDRIAAGTLKVHHLVEIGIEIADALEAAHSQGIIHRDIKPANLFLIERGHVKIMDFGLAKLIPGKDPSGATAALVSDDHLTEPGITLGTVSYMSPEQAAGDALDGRTDLFSLGVVLYECATGRLPFTGSSTVATLNAILNRAPVAAGMFNPDLPLRLQEVINNCLEKDRDLRYQTAADLRADLKRVKRDLESGRSGAVMTVATSHHTSRAAELASGSAAPPSVPVPGAEPAAPVPSPPALAAVPGSPWSLTAKAAVIAVGLLGAIVASYVFWPSRPAPVVETAPARDTRIAERRQLAIESYEAKHYRAALAYADQVLAFDPADPQAVSIRERSRQEVERLDAAIADARRLLDAGDTKGAARTLETARAIDATASDVAALSAQVATRLSAEVDAARREIERARMAPIAPPPPAPKARPGAARVESRPDARSGDETAARRDTGAAVPAPPPATTTAGGPPAPSPGAAQVQPIPAEPTQAPPPDLPKSRPAEPVASPPRPASPPEARPLERSDHATVASPSADDDRTAIDAVLATYARAIETKNLALFRSVKPDLSHEEEQRIEAGFRAVASQRVTIRILSLERRGQEAHLRLQRQDTIDAGGRRQTAESQQSMTLVRAENGRWTIVRIGR